MTEHISKEVVEKLMHAPSACKEAVQAGERYLKAVGTPEEEAARKALVEELKEDVTDSLPLRLPRRARLSLARRGRKQPERRPRKPRRAANTTASAMPAKRARRYSGKPVRCERNGAP